MKPLEFAQILISPKFQRAVWTRGDGLEIYMRRGNHCINGEVVACLDVANVNADEPGNGAFTSFIEKAENMVKNSGTCNFIFVESIMDPRFMSYLKKRGYELQENCSEFAPNMFKDFSAVAGSSQ